MHRQFPILLIGLSSVGKTYIGHFLSKQHRTDFSATNGCAAYKFIYNNNIVRLTEIGGSNDIRDIWHVYFKNVSFCIINKHIHFSICRL